MITNENVRFEMIIFLVVLFMLLSYLSNVFNGFGVYINDDKVYYKTLKRKEVDINSIVGIKIIKAEGQVNIAWSSFDMKDKEGKVLYSMMFLSNMEKGMKEYPYGDLEFKRRYRKSIIMQSVYDKNLIEYFKEHLISLEVLDWLIKSSAAAFKLPQNNTKSQKPIEPIVANWGRTFLALYIG